MYAAVISFILVLIVMPYFIRFMRERQFGQEIRDEGPTWHRSKSGTPTMGGLVFLFATIVSTLIYSLGSGYSGKVLLLFLTLIFYGGIGFWDDFLKIERHQNEGLKAKQKFGLQLLSGLVLILVWMITLKTPYPQFPLWVVIPFIIIWLTGFSNAFNLTDGIDGLAGGNGIISLLGYMFLALKQGQNDIAVFALILAMSLLGFLFFNRKPAKVFMGDAGSVAVGAVLAMLSLLVHHPFSLLFIGFIYVMETVSVILQVISFQSTGKRLFKMTPIHHHFEMSGWSEWKIDFVFWSITLVLTLLTVVFLG